MAHTWADLVPHKDLPFDTASEVGTPAAKEVCLPG